MGYAIVKAPKPGDVVSMPGAESDEDWQVTHVEYYIPKYDSWYVNVCRPGDADRGATVMATGRKGCWQEMPSPEDRRR